MLDALNLKKTALVMIDLQKGIALNPHLAPYSSQEVLEKNQRLVNHLQDTEALIVCVHVENYGPERLQALTENGPLSQGELPDDFSHFILPIAQDKATKNVIHVKKHNWGAFYGTDLDVQLRRRGIDTILLTGVATSVGCDTTAREAYQADYQVIAVEDAMTDFNGDLHHAIIKHIFGRLGLVRKTEEVVDLIHSSM